MRSPTLRGVSEWSRGKDLYMGSHILGSEKSVVFSYCAGKLLEGFRGFRRGPEVHKWVHHNPRASMGSGEAPWPYWARRTKSSKAHVARECKKGRSPSRNRIGLGVQVLSPLAAP